MSEQLRSGAGSFADLGRLIGGIGIALISIGMLLGGFLMNSIDALGIRPTPTQAIALQPALPSPMDTSSPSPSPMPSSTAAPTLPPTATKTPSVATETTATKTPVLTPSPTPPEPLIPVCPHPTGWVVYIVQPGDTLASLAWRTNTTSYALMQANCLGTPTIYLGQQIYLPPTFHATPTSRPYTCGPPLGWVVYYVQPKDTLYGLSRRYGVGIDTIRRANCLSGYTIYIGQALYLPPLLYTLTPTPVPTLPATPTPTVMPTYTPTPSATAILPPPATITVTITPTYTPTPTGTITATLTPTFTPSPTGTTPALTYTPTPTATESSPTPTPTPSPTEPTPTSTYTPISDSGS